MVAGGIGLALNTSEDVDVGVGDEVHIIAGCRPCLDEELEATGAVGKLAGESRYFQVLAVCYVEGWMLGGVAVESVGEVQTISLLDGSLFYLTA